MCIKLKIITDSVLKCWKNSLSLHMSKFSEGFCQEHLVKKIKKKII